MPSRPQATKPVPKPKVAEKILDFNRDVRPILSEHCYTCHGPSTKDVAGGLRLDNSFSATKDRGFFAIKPGHPEFSVALGRAMTDVPGLQMPPPSSGKRPLNAKEIETLRLWIKQGAKYKTHWAFLPPSRSALPPVKTPGWVKTWIDRFTLAAMEAKGFKPEPEADKATLVRRVALATTGLQATSEEIDAYVRDKRPNAYALMVDRYLAKPQYGEHQARYWLDAVRYGDTHGLHLDNERSIFPYRDWVVRAFNQDLPYDEFLTAQFAGDLLKNPTLDQRIATGFIRMNPTTAEGGAIEEEFLAKNTFDRLDTVGTVVLGLTVSCARCHDHKYDPISIRDYYRMYAYFNSTKDAPLDGNELAPAPAIRAPEPADQRRLAGMDDEMGKLKAAVDLDAARKWVNTAEVEPPVVGKFEIAGPYPQSNYDAAFNYGAAPEPGGPGGQVEWRPFDLVVGQPKATVVGRDNAAVYIRTTITSAIKRGSELRVGSDDGVKVWLNGQLVHQNASLRALAIANDRVAVTLQPGANTLLLKVVNSTGGDGVYLAVGDALVEKVQALARDIQANGLAGDRESQLRAIFLEAGPTTESSNRYRTLLRERTALYEAQPLTLVAEEMDKPRETFVLKRGEYNLPTDRVWRSVPTILGSLPARAPNNRLGFAQWLTDRRHPLTSRVWVNRIWLQHFGTGLVKSAEDFGNQGDWPSHPELLDTLAVDFREQGWSLKQLHRLILNSATFRQRSVVQAAKLERDPENRLLARGPRFRLDAEVVRDKALFAAGTLNLRQGGRGFRPYQPAGLWEAIAFPTSNTANYVQDKGPDIYRRSLYMFWKRTSPHPIMLTFDAPLREACVVRRSRTNTPLQALVTMNETAFVEASRAFAERIIKARPADDARLRFAFQKALGRNPSQREQAILMQSLATYRKQFAASPKDAESMLVVGDSPRDATIPAPETASWMIVANTLFNTDEFLTLK